MLILYLLIFLIDSISSCKHMQVGYTMKFKRYQCYIIVSKSYLRNV